MARLDPVLTGRRSSLLPRHVTRHLQHNWMRVEEVGLVMGAVLLCRKFVYFLFYFSHPSTPEDNTAPV